MELQTISFLVVGLTLALYIGIAFWSRVASTGDFYVAGKHVHPVTNGMATAADWMSAASFISMAGLIAFLGRDGSIYLMGWTGGYVLLAMLIAPYLRKFNKYTVPDFIGDRYYSNVARTVAVVCLLFVSFTYVAGQMRGVGIVFSRFLEVDINTGVAIGMGIVFLYAVLGGMKGVTYTQVAQYCVLIFAYTVPAFFLSFQLTGNPLPQAGFGSTLSEGPQAGRYLLHALDETLTELGFGAYTAGNKSTADVFFITAALMCGTAGLPHVIVRFFTVPTVRAARVSAAWALLFIALLYSTAPAVGAFARMNLVNTVQDASYAAIPRWFKNWENSGLIAWLDKNSDGRIQYAAGAPFEGKPAYAGSADDAAARGPHGERGLSNAPAEGRNELYVDRDIMVLANPEIADLPNWVIALVAAGGLAAALSTAAGLLLVISSAISHDLLKGVIARGLSERQELTAARISAAVAIFIAGLFGIHPPGFVAQVVAFAFGLAASSFLPVIMLGIFSRRMNKEGAIAGMLAGLCFTFGYIVFFKFIAPERNDAEYWLFGISPEGIGTLGMILNFVVAIAVSCLTAPPPEHVQRLVEDIRVPQRRIPPPAPPIRHSRAGVCAKTLRASSE
ncbi:MAG: cation acetate symporter [Gammaproteobacteria bacterium]|nr:cation acetate symporter [Gammaproteobacteria bacterium]